MKHFLKKLAAGAVALALLGTSLISCHHDDGDDGPSLSKIEVTTKPTQIEYALDSDGSATLNTAGAVVTATWSNNKTEDVTAKSTFVPSSFSSETLGESTKKSVDVKATYGGKESEAFAVTLYASETVKTTYEKISDKKITIGTTVITIDANGNATDQDGNAVIISVDEEGKVLATLSNGTVYYATIDENGTTTVKNANGDTVDAKVEDNSEETEPSAGGTQTLTAVSIEGPSTTIDYNAADVEVKAVPTATGNPEIAYEWTITDESGVVTTEKTGTGNPFKFTVNNTDAESEKTISVTVKASAPIDDETVEVSPESATQITIGKHGVIQPKVTSVTIGYESGKEELREFKVGQAYKLHAVVVADEGMGEVEWSAEPASAVEIEDASSDASRTSETAPVTVTMKEVTDAVVITLRSTKDTSKSDSITLKIEAATVVDEVEEDATLDWNASDYDAVSSITTETTFGVVTAIATSQKNLTIEAITTANAEEASYKYGTKTFTKRLKLNGTGKTTERALKVTATKAGTIKVYAISGSSSADRVLILEDSNGNKTEKTALGARITLLAYDVSAAGDYYIYSKSSGINIFAISGLSEPKVLSKIEVTTEPTQKTYAIGDSLNTAGLVVTATYTVGSNSTTEDVTADCTLSAFDSSSAGDKVITVSYTSGSVTKTTTFTVTVDAAAATVTEISVKTHPTTLSYKAGEKFDPAGLVITVKKNDESESDVTYSDDTKAGFSFSPSLETALTATDTKVTVSYSSRTAVVTIAVKNIVTTTIDLTSAPEGFAGIPTTDAKTSGIIRATLTEDAYLGSGVSVLKNAAVDWRSDKKALFVDVAQAMVAEINGPYTIKVTFFATAKNRSNRKVSLYAGTDKSALFSSTAVKSEGNSTGVSDTATTIAYENAGATGTSYVGIGLSNDGTNTSDSSGIATYITKIEIITEEAAPDSAEAELASAKAYWTRVSTAYANLDANKFYPADVSSVTTVLNDTLTEGDIDSYVTKARAVEAARAALVDYKVPTKITIKNGEEDVTEKTLEVNTLVASSIPKLTATADSEHADLQWAITGIENVTREDDGTLAFPANANGTATVTVSDKRTTSVTAKVTLTVTSSENKISASEAAATIKASSEKVTVGKTVTLTATLSKTYTDSTIKYLWYKGEATEVLATTDTNTYEYTAVEGDLGTNKADNAVSFSVVVQGDNEIKSAKSEAVSVTVSNAPSVTQTAWDMSTEAKLQAVFNATTTPAANTEHTATVVNGLTLKTSSTNNYYKGWDSSGGIKIKNDALTISGLSTSADFTITINVAKGGSSRGLTIKDGTTSLATSDTSATFATGNWSSGNIRSTSGTITINASNDIVIGSITISK